MVNPDHRGRRDRARRRRRSPRSGSATPSLAKMFWRWRATVCSLITRAGGDLAVALAVRQRAGAPRARAPTGRGAGAASGQGVDGRDVRAAPSISNACAPPRARSRRVLVAERPAGRGRPAPAPGRPRTARSSPCQSASAAAARPARRAAVALGLATQRGRARPPSPRATSLVGRLRDARRASRHAARAASSVVDASMISTYAGSRPARSSCAVVSPTARRIAAAAVGTSLPEAEQGEAGLRLAAVRLASRYSCLGRRRRPLQAVDLALAVERLPEAIWLSAPSVKRSAAPRAPPRAQPAHVPAAA